MFYCSVRSNPHDTVGMVLQAPNRVSSFRSSWVSSVSFTSQQHICAEWCGRIVRGVPSIVLSANTLLCTDAFKSLDPS
jgi:hypothetical protein